MATRIVKATLLEDNITELGVTRDELGGKLETRWGWSIALYAQTSRGAPLPPPAFPLCGYGRQAGERAAITDRGC